ncbi:DUF6805 domain-containing protein [Promicromonospora sp. NPDC060271]|uniref:DUF6805 domain-containing protein n=1 Tax=Promicromonospora sp. NPDC060271 TaxID=3347089 RepID=UPI0036664E1E
MTAGEQQPEVDHGFVGEWTRAGGADGLHWRSTTGWFEYRLRCPDGAASVRTRFVDRAATRRRILLNGLEVDPSRTLTAPADGEGLAEHEYDLTQAVRDAGAPGETVFRVEAVDGADSGDLLVVEMVPQES